MSPQTACMNRSHLLNLYDSSPKWLFKWVLNWNLIYRFINFFEVSFYFPEVFVILTRNKFCFQSLHKCFFFASHPDTEKSMMMKGSVIIPLWGSYSRDLWVVENLIWLCLALTILSKRWHRGKCFLFSEHCYKNGNLKYPKNSYFNIVRCKILIFKNVRRIVLDHK